MVVRGYVWGQGGGVEGGGGGADLDMVNVRGLVNKLISVGIF